MKIGRYQILEVIGQGAMGTVYKARDPLIERTVAIKTVPITRLKEEGAEFESRFLREAQSAGRLSHPNIVTIYDVGETDKVAYIAMEFLSGKTLRDIMDHGPMPLDLVANTAFQIAEALAYAHEHGVIHRDIKPSNVVITRQHGQVKLTDFGIAHLTNSERTHAGLMLGSPRYMSPEQAMGREIDGRSDIFSLGAVLFEMVTGEYAFKGESLPSILYQVINEPPASATTLRPEINPAFARIIMRMLDKQTAERYESRTLVQELHRATQPPSTPVSTEVENHVHRSLPVIAFLTPFLTFFIIGIGIILIGHFLSTVPKNSGLPSNLTRILATPSKSVTLTNATPDTPKQMAQAAKLASGSIKLPHDAYLKGLDTKKIELEVRKTELLLRYTRAHPDVQSLERQLAQLAIERRRYLKRHRSK
ncbi:MAG: protein kinase [Thiobacillaceae bacterium]